MDRDAALDAEKAALRMMMKERRRSLPEQSRNAMSVAIAGYVMTLPEIINARHIHLYLSIPELAEVATSLIVDGCTIMDKQLSVPVIRNGELLSAAFRKGDALRAAQFGLPEPVALSIADESNLDVVLMPLLAFDERGYRIGYGKGFYDRFLQRLSLQGVTPCRIGLSFFLQKVETVPADSRDEPLDGVVHEHGIIRFNSNL
jgi:5-formyltetrahydrofolate cyclo-ligase